MNALILRTPVLLSVVHFADVKIEIHQLCESKEETESRKGKNDIQYSEDYLSQESSKLIKFEYYCFLCLGKQHKMTYKKIEKKKRKNYTNKV